MIVLENKVREECRFKEKEKIIKKLKYNAAVLGIKLKDIVYALYGNNEKMAKPLINELVIYQKITTELENKLVSF